MTKSGRDENNRPFVIRKKSFIFMVLIVFVLSASLLVSGPLSSLSSSQATSSSSQPAECREDPKSDACKQALKELSEKEEQQHDQQETESHVQEQQEQEDQQQQVEENEAEERDEQEQAAEDQSSTPTPAPEESVEKENQLQGEEKQQEQQQESSSEEPEKLEGTGSSKLSSSNNNTKVGSGGITIQAKPPPPQEASCKELVKRISDKTGGGGPDPNFPLPVICPNGLTVFIKYPSDVTTIAQFCSPDSRAEVQGFFREIKACEDGRCAKCKPCEGRTPPLTTCPAFFGSYKCIPPGDSCNITCGGRFPDRCENTCTNFKTDNDNCGGCGSGNSCTSKGATCQAGECKCPTGKTMCGGTCKDTNTDTQNCGGCGNPCSISQTCQAGSCNPCSTGQLACNNICVNANSDLNNCGACGNKCADDEKCEAGSCEPKCSTGLSLCGNTCSNLAIDEQNCGTCGNQCPSGQICTNAQCGQPCLSGLTQCGNTCSNLQIDGQNCGTCGNACGSGQTCEGGQCSGTPTSGTFTLTELLHYTETGVDENGVPRTVVATETQDYTGTVVMENSDLSSLKLASIQGSCKNTVTDNGVILPQSFTSSPKLDGSFIVIDQEKGVIKVGVTAAPLEHPGTCAWETNNMGLPSGGIPYTQSDSAITASGGTSVPCGSPNVTCENNFSWSFNIPLS